MNESASFRKKKRANKVKKGGLQYRNDMEPTAYINEGKGKKYGKARAQRWFGRAAAQKR